MFKFDSYSLEYKSVLYLNEHRIGQIQRRLYIRIRKSRVEPFLPEVRVRHVVLREKERGFYTFEFNKEKRATVEVHAQNR